MSAAAVLRRLHDAGVEVIYEEPDNIRLKGPLTADLVELARGAKADLLLLVRPTVQAVPCSCCGRFFFAEPAVVCFWCRTPEVPAQKAHKSGVTDEAGTSATIAPVNPGPGIRRACPSCGGGLQPTDPDGAECFTCRHVTGGGAT